MLRHVLDFKQENHKIIITTTTSGTEAERQDHHQSLLSGNMSSFITRFLSGVRGRRSTSNETFKSVQKRRDHVTHSLNSAKKTASNFS